jgi:predicted nucleic acid-binding protein
MGKKFLTDTNPLIEYIGGTFNKDSASSAYDAINNDFNISVITRIEILAHPLANNALYDFFSLADQYSLSPEIVNKTIEIRKTYKTKLPDAIIAATALVHELTLITNDSDFNKIKGLNILNPYNFK